MEIRGTDRAGGGKSGVLGQAPLQPISGAGKILGEAGAMIEVFTFSFPLLSCENDFHLSSFSCVSCFLCLLFWHHFQPSGAEKSLIWTERDQIPPGNPECIGPTFTGRGNVSSQMDLRPRSGDDLFVSPAA